MIPSRHFFIRTALAIALVSLLGACANMANTPPGTPLAQVEAQFGAPNHACPEPDGGQRLIWSTAPAGQYAWGTHVDRNGRTDRIVQILTDQHFQILAQGYWTPEKVRCEFGPPAIIDTVGLPSVRQIVWSYRYKQAKAWNSLMYVYFGKDGSHVTRFHPGPDPLYDEERWMF